MRKSLIYHMTIIAAVMYCMASIGVCHAQSRKTALPQEKEIMHYIVEGKDTIYIDEIRASKVYARIPKQKGKDWRKYYRLVHNFSKAYPYALVARKLVAKADSTIAADKLKRLKKEKYVNAVQKELFEVFEGQMRKMTVSQGALLMKLIDRQKFI